MKIWSCRSTLSSVHSFLHFRIFKSIRNSRKTQLVVFISGSFAWLSRFFKPRMMARCQNILTYLELRICSNHSFTIPLRWEPRRCEISPLVQDCNRLLVGYIFRQLANYEWTSSDLNVKVASEKPLTTLNFGDFLTQHVRQNRKNTTCQTKFGAWNSRLVAF